MKNILMLANDDAGQEARLQAALDLTRAFEGHLTCLDITTVPVMLGDPYATAIEAEIFATNVVNQAAFRKAFEQRLAREDVSWTWIEAKGSLADALTDHAGLADLIVVSRKLESARSPNTRSIASEVVVSSGRTVVAVPEQPLGFKVGGRAIVAYDGSKEAAEALGASVPLLKLARKVEIFEISDGADSNSAEEAATYLSRHGIKPMIVKRTPGVARTAQVLLDQLDADQADYVVMGGFGHSRTFETLFGGVSHKMLGESPIPVVMAH